MFDSQQKNTGTQYTMTVALLVVALILIPTVLILSQPFGYVAISLALASSAVCLGFAWVNWKKYSQLTIPSIAPHDSRTR